MTEEVKTTDTTETSTAPAVTATVTKGSESLKIDAPHVGKDTPSDEVTPEKLGVSQAQFDKFFDAKTGTYNWQNHAKELAWQITQRGSAEKPAEKPAEKITDASAAAAVDKAGLDMDALTMEIAEKGDLSQESLDALAKVGIPADTAKGYVGYLKATAQKHVDEVQAYLGGPQGMATLKDWAIKNLTADERVKFEQKLSDPSEWKVYADSLKARAGVRSGSQSKLLHGQNAQAGSGTQAAGYESQAEMQADIRNPKYKKDAAFRNQVAARARASNFTQNPRAHTV